MTSGKLIKHYVYLRRHLIDQVGDVASENGVSAAEQARRCFIVGLRAEQRTLIDVSPDGIGQCLGAIAGLQKTVNLLMSLLVEQKTIGVHPNGESMSEKLLTVPVPFLSTAHVTQEDDRMLREDDLSKVILLFKPNAQDGYGHFVHVGEQVDEDEVLLDAGFSQSFVDLLNWAYENKYEYVRIDSCGDRVAGLEVHDWDE